MDRKIVGEKSNGSVCSKRAHPPGHLSGICHLVGPGGGDLSENLVVPFSTFH